MHNFERFRRDLENLAVVVAFDPGGTTGWAVLGIDPDVLSSGTNVELATLLRDSGHIEYGQIGCQRQGGSGWSNTANKHAGLMLAGENDGVNKMMDLVNVFCDKAAIVLEDFIPDPKKFDQARHTLSPVRIISAFCYAMETQGFNLDRVHIQNRSLAKTTATNLRLQNWGLYDDSSGRHSRDAIRHAYYFMRDCSEIGIKSAEKRHLAWPHLFSDPLRVDGVKKTVPRKVVVGERIRPKR